MKYKRFLEQHITFYNGQLYCYRCKITLKDFKEGNRHLEDAHSSISSQISDFLNKMKLSKKNCMELVKQGIIIREIQQDYFCVYCLSSISSLHDFSQHLKEENHKCISSKSILKHSTNKQQKSNDNTSNEQTKAFVNVDNSMKPKNKSNAIIQSVSENMLMKDTSNSSIQIGNETITNVPYALMEKAKTYKHFLILCRIYTVHTYNGQWYCHLCESVLQSLIDMTCHLQEVHPDSGTQISNFLDKSIKLSDTNGRESSNHEIAMQDVLQDYFCVSCQCSLPSLNHLYEHSVGKRHKHMTQCSEKNVNTNVVLNEPADKPNLNNNTINNQNISIDVQNDFIRNLPSSFKAEEKSTISLKSYNKDSISEDKQKQSKSCIHTAFCCLCDTFIYRTTIEDHMISKNHKFAASLFLKIQISNQQTCIIKLEGERKTLRSLQLNNKKFDGTTWPEHAEIVSKYTCDQCNKMVEQDDIINHEITIHKSGMMFSMRFIYNWSPTSKNLNVTIYYPLFKCSFCNEIIHGIASLQAHFSKYEHKEIIKSLIDIKRREYDSCKNIQIYLEPIEFLSLISFENNAGTIQIQEQPVMYIKTHCTTLCKNAVKMQKTFTYVCFDCSYAVYKINGIIDHLSNTSRHLNHFQNVFLTYKYIHNVSTSREFTVNESEHEVKSPVSKDVSIDNKSLMERNIDKTQVNTEQYGNHNLTVEMNFSNTSNRMSQNEENNYGFFISPDIFTEINTLIKGNYESYQSSTKLNKNSALDRYNKMYWKEFLDFEEIMFVCNERKLMKIKSHLQFFVPYSDKMLCLICDNLQLYNVQAIYEHINTDKHIIQFNMLHENKEYLEVLKLLRQLVKIKPAYTKCFACNIHAFQNEISNLDFKNHIYISSHKKNCQQLRSQAEFILEEFQNLWYNIQYFACVDCNTKFKMKIKFMEHLNNVHREVIRNKINSRFDFCLTCATLWYQNKIYTRDIPINYQKHCQIQMHQYLKTSNDFAVTPLPQPLQKLLENVNKISANLYKLSNKVLNDPKVTQLTGALKHIFGTCQLLVEVFMFGSRVTGLALTNSDIDIYLNFGDECTEPESIKRRSKQIQDCLHTDHENWDIELTLDRSRTPIIKVKHRSTGLQCDISFMNGLSVENSKLIRSFNTAYPPCHKLTLFLKKWLSLAGLNGPDGITNYALVWLVIFYLQVTFKIPSIADLIKSHNQSKIISGWETGVNDTILINVPQKPIHELLLGFFEYYGGFDYMRLVICPLLGETCQKKTFAEVSTLPNSMALYIAQLQHNKPEYFRIDSPMCVQDPYDLSHNLTKAVSILTLKHFKHYCNESLSVLRSVIAKSSKKRY